MSKKILITGITGMDGSILAEHALNLGWEVHGIVRRSSSFNTKRLDHIFNSKYYNKQFFTHYGDMIDQSSLNSIISSLQPDYLFNCAAQSHVKVSFETPVYTAQSDAIGVLNVLESIRSFSPFTKFLQCSTSEQFGGIKELMPEKGYNENSYFYPRSPYGVSKLFGYWITKNYREAYNLFACNSICFNHCSPRRGETFLTRKVTLWCKNYYRNSNAKPLELGNLNSYRDEGHAYDYIRAMIMMLEQAKADDYVISTGKAFSVRQFVEKCFHWMQKDIKWEGEGINEVGLVDGKVVIKIDPKYFRPSEVDYLLGDNTKIKSIGWEPKYNIDLIVDEMMRCDVLNEPYILLK